jgi:putative SOS response-associated peptidase YedK
VKPPSYNAAPSQLLYVIRENHDTGERVLGLLRWGLIPLGCTDPDGGRKPINSRVCSRAVFPRWPRGFLLRSSTLPLTQTPIFVNL